MYCAMTGITRGHLVVYYTPRSGDGAVLSAYAVELSHLAEIRTGMIRRRALSQRALYAATLSGLAKCGGAVSTRRSPRRCNTDSREDSGVSLSGCGPWLIASPCSGGSQRWSARLVSGA